MPAELHYAADIGSLCRRREIADGHVLDHTATERAHLGHLGTSCPKGWAVDTLILADRRRPSRPLSFCRDSGFVQSAEPIGNDGITRRRSCESRADSQRLNQVRPELRLRQQLSPQPVAATCAAAPASRSLPADTRAAPA